MKPADPEAFKFGMRQLTGHVCLITTIDASAKRHGLTATAVCSVSITPPTLLCCVNRQIAPYAAIRESGLFAVNVLASGQRQLADRFAGEIDGEERFAVGDWERLGSGAPGLRGALAVFDCRLTQLEEVATHGILFGEIRDVEWRESGKPLLYGRGTYGSFTSIE